MPLNLVVRTSDSSYPKVMGTQRPDIRREEGLNELLSLPPLLRTKRYFPVQIACKPISFDTNPFNNKFAESNNENGPDHRCHQQPFLGCCGAEFSRMILLREMNFVVCNDLWDLYVMSYQNYHWDSALPTVYKCLHMALVPHSEKAIVEECRKWESWTFLRTCNACMLRMDLESAIRKYLRSDNSSAPVNNVGTSVSFHWHVDVFMDSVTDESHKIISVSTAIPFFEQDANSITEKIASLKIKHEEDERNEQICEATVHGGNQPPKKYRSRRRQKKPNTYECDSKSK